MWFVVGVMAVLLALRFILLLAGANESAGFAQLVYGLTGCLLFQLIEVVAKRRGIYEREA